MSQNDFEINGATPEKRTFKSRFTRKKIIKLSVAAIIIGLIVWDCFIDSPPFWHFRQDDKKAIVDYQRQHYPGAKVVDRNFPFLGNPGLVGCRVPSSMTFEYDGVEFGIVAEYGRVSLDGFYEARTKAQFNEIIQDGFLKPRNIVSSIHYSFRDDYTSTYPYTAVLYVELRAVNQGSTPQEVGWLYDFYKYWKREGAFLKDYQLNIYIYEDNVKRSYLVIKRDSEFSNEDEFYSAFRSEQWAINQ